MSSKPDDNPTATDAAQDIISESNSANVESDNEDGDDEVEESVAGAGAQAAKKKKKSKKKRIKAAVGIDGGDGAEGTKNYIEKAVGSLSKSQLEELLLSNPALAAQLREGAGGADLSSASIVEQMKKLKLEDIMTGLAANGKNVKDMGSYKFWQTQPVPKFGESSEIVEGPFKIIDPETVSKEPFPLPGGYYWVTMNLKDEAELKEVFDLLYGHYVEDSDSQFRFNYSIAFLKWALMAPGWRPDWHVGVRAPQSAKLVAFVSAVPVELRVREKVLHASEVNFLSVHTKLRGQRLTPMLIKEITRRCYLLKTYQAVYTAGVVLPKPVSTTRYFHRSLDWEKLYSIGFSPLPRNSKPSYQIAKYKLPDRTSMKGLRPMETKDIDAVLNLLKRYLQRFEMAPVFTREEIVHWLLHKDGEQVVWSYVVEDASGKLTDYISFYIIESSVLKNDTYKSIRAAYLYYYATEVGIGSSVSTLDLKGRLNELVHNALILAKKYKFDVFNALTLMDNALFLDELKFGGGDGQLHYYLYNYNANPISGGVDRANNVDEKSLSGIGLVML